MRTLLLIIITATQFTFCTQTTTNYKPYYFPADKMYGGLVYEYMPLNGDTSNREYWYYRTFDRDSGQYLVSTFYDRHFRIGQILREKIVSNGSLAKELYLYEPNFTKGTEEKITVNIEAATIFPFEIKDTTTGLFLFKINYRLPEDTVSKIYVIKNRSFGGKGTDFAFKGKKHATIKINLKEVAGNESEGVAEGEAQGVEWYAKDLGLVYFKKQYGEGGNQVVREFMLKNVFPMTELERRAKHILDSD